MPPQEQTWDCNTQPLTNHKFTTTPHAHLHLAREWACHSRPKQARSQWRSQGGGAEAPHLAEQAAVTSVRRLYH